MTVKIKNVLISFVGSTDDPTKVTFGSIIALADKRFRDEMALNPSLPPDTIRKITSVAYEFDKFILLYTGDKRSTDWTENVHNKLVEAGKEVIPLNLAIDDPLNYEEICWKTVDAFSSIKNSEREKYYASISSGTPTMHTCWFYMAMNKLLPLTLLRVRNPVEVQGQQNYVEIVVPFVARNQRFDFQVSPKLTVDELSFEKALKQCNIIASGQKLKNIYKKAFKVEENLNKLCRNGRHDAILINGESGTGKEEMANFIHVCSDRSGGPFVPVNCAAIPETLLESELFGHIRGAFTGAIANRKGKFLEAHGGTIFLDEIGELSTQLQAKLLRAIQNKEISPVGDSKVVKVDVRVIAATNIDIKLKLKEKVFREDLYYRFVDRYLLPPLRAVREEVKPLSLFFVDKIGKHNDVKKELSESALCRLQEYAWPGNIRELRNVINTAYIMTDNYIIDADDVVINPVASSNGIEEALRDFVFMMIDGGMILNDIESELRHRLFLVLETYRADTGMTQKALAKLIGRTPVHYSNRKKKAVQTLQAK